MVMVVVMVSMVSWRFVMVIGLETFRISVMVSIAWGLLLFFAAKRPSTLSGRVLKQRTARSNNILYS